MRLASVRRGDRIEATVRGYRFEATVKNPQCGEIPGKPVLIDPPHNCTFFHLDAHQVTRILERGTAQESLL